MALPHCHPRVRHEVRLDRFGPGEGVACVLSTAEGFSSLGSRLARPHHLGILGPSLRNIVIVLAITGWVVYARIVRAEILSLRTREFVTAGRSLGGGDVRIIVRHLLPNVMSSVIVLATLEVARMLLLESALSFLGLGVRPPTPSWGAMLADGRVYLATAWWLATFPGLAISLTVLCLNAGSATGCAIRWIRSSRCESTD